MSETILRFVLFIVKVVEKNAPKDKHNGNFIISTNDLQNIFITIFLHIKHGNMSGL